LDWTRIPERISDRSVDAIQAGLPSDPQQMFRPDRLAEMAVGKPNWFSSALATNEAFRWVPQAALRLYFGDLDTDVSPEDSKNFHATASKLGGNVHLVPLGPYAHGDSAYRGVPLARLWFDELSATAQVR
jgi:hypothetical protein